MSIHRFVPRLAAAAAVVTLVAVAVAQQPQQPGAQQPVQPPVQQVQPGQVVQPQQQVRPGQPAQPQQPTQQQQIQQQNQQRQAVTANRPVTGGMSNDQIIATCLAIGNQKEIATAQIAASKTGNRQVREYAEMLVRDHGKTQETLARFGGRAELDQQEAPRGSAQAVQGTSAQFPAGQAGQATPGIDFLQVERRVAQMCIDNARKEWNDQKPEECDQAYLGTQIVAHQQMIDKQQVLRDYASPELRAQLEQSIQTAKAHRDKAHELIKSLAKADTTERR